MAATTTGPGSGRACRLSDMESAYTCVGFCPACEKRRGSQCQTEIRPTPYLPYVKPATSSDLQPQPSSPRPKPTSNRQHGNKRPWFDMESSCVWRAPGLIWNRVAFGVHYGRLMRSHSAPLCDKSGTPHMLYKSGTPCMLICPAHDELRVQCEGSSRHASAKRPSTS
jgi:hypothetical protein